MGVLGVLLDPREDADLPGKKTISLHDLIQLQLRSRNCAANPARNPPLPAHQGMAACSSADVTSEDAMVQDERDGQGTRWNTTSAFAPIAAIVPQSVIKCCHLQPLRQSGSNAAIYSNHAKHDQMLPALSLQSLPCSCCPRSCCPRPCSSWDVVGRCETAELLVLSGTPAAPKAAIAQQGGGPAHAGSGTQRAAWRAAPVQWAPLRLQLESAGRPGQHKSRQSWKTVRVGHRSRNAAGRSVQSSDQIATNGAPTRQRQGMTGRTARR